MFLGLHSHHWKILEQGGLGRTRRRIGIDFGTRVGLDAEDQLSASSLPSRRRQERRKRRQRS